ncbi:MAG: VanZ family protein, partial [Candidatus Hydrogenedentota bacterium]
MAIWAGIILVTVPFGRNIVNTTTRTINALFGTDDGYQWIGHAAATAAALALVVTLVRQILKSARGEANAAGNIERVRVRIGRIVLLLILISVYGWLFAQMKIPVEKVHFLEYGLLVWLSRRAWSLHLAFAATWPAAALLGGIIGATDEWFQYVTPGRHAEAADVAWNCWAALLPVLILRVLSTGSTEDIGPRDRRILRVLSAGFIALVSLFLVVTQEFGVRIDDPRGYTFFSRTESPARLRSAATAGSAQVIADLADPSPYVYSDFLEKFRQDDRPAENEMRVHLFRRDRYLAYYVHKMVRMEVARGESSDTIDRLIGDPLIGRALRAYVCDYDRDWIVKNIGVPEPDPEIHAAVRAWIMGESVAWGDSLWHHYLGLHKEKASKDPGTETEALGDLFVAERENRILEDYFREPITGSGNAWTEAFGEEMRLRLREHPAWSAAMNWDAMFPGYIDKPYTSAVAERIITRFQPGGIIAFAAVVLILLLLMPQLLLMNSTPRAAGFLVVFLAIILPVIAGDFIGNLVSPPAVPTLEQLGEGRASAAVLAVDRAILVDGNLDDWPAAPMHLLMKADTFLVASPRTEFRLAVDSAGTLFAAVKAFDTDQVASLQGRDEDLWREDAIEFFFQISDRYAGTYWEFEFNPLNAVYDAQVEWRRSIDFEKSKAWSSAGIRSAVTRDSESWTLEVAYPGLGRSGFLRGNICRI